MICFVRNKLTFGIVYTSRWEFPVHAHKGPRRKKMQSTCGRSVCTRAPRTCQRVVRARMCMPTFDAANESHARCKPQKRSLVLVLSSTME